jgi:hypothetical protein
MAITYVTRAGLVAEAQAPPPLCSPQAFYSIRSERQLVELFRWFVGLGMEDVVWDASQRTATGCWIARWWELFRGGAVARQDKKTVVGRSLLARLMARCWKRGRARRASAQRMPQASRRARGATAGRAAGLRRCPGPK